MLILQKISVLIKCLLMMFCTTGKITFTQVPEMYKSFNMSMNVLNPTSSFYTNVADKRFIVNKIHNWNALLSNMCSVVHFMICSTNKSTYGIAGSSTLEKRKRRHSFVFIYTYESAKVIWEFEKALSCSEAAPKVIAWEMDVFSSKDQLLEILLKSLAMEKDVRGVIVASSHVDFIHLIFDIVTSDAQFKWRLLFHATEWLVLTTEHIPQNSPLLNHEHLPDFMTVASAQEFYVEINQKSRTQPMKKVLEIAVDMVSPVRSKTIRQDSYKFCQKTFQPIKMSQTKDETFVSLSLRKDAMTFLSFMKSEMADMIIPTVALISQQERSAFLEKKGNTTYWTGFNIDILNVLSDFLGFTAELFPVSDGGFFSVFQPKGDILGVTGYLKRREAGLTAMDMVSSTQRRDVIDFIYSSVRDEVFYIMYKINQGKSQLGDPRSELIDTKQDLIFFLIGPCIVMVVGLFVFLVSGVFSTAERIYGPENLKRLCDFPFQCMFQTTERYPHQSGRILRASWGLFCVAMFASYGALLTTNATAPPEYPKLTDVWDLLKHPNFKIGINPGNSYFMTTIQNAPEESALGNLWRIAFEQNKSDHRTFSLDKVYHIRRVLEGNYAFLDFVHMGLISSLVDADYTDIRFATLFASQPRMSVPKDAFYIRDLELALTTVNQIGLTKAISDRWFTPKESLRRSKVEYDSTVGLFRLSFLLHIAVIGICLAFLALVAECTLNKFSCVDKVKDLATVHKH